MYSAIHEISESIVHLLINYTLTSRNLDTVKVFLRGHPQVAKKVSVTGAGRLRECISIEFFWELRKTGFCEGGGK